MWNYMYIRWLINWSDTAVVSFCNNFGEFEYSEIIIIIIIIIIITSVQGI